MKEFYNCLKVLILKKKSDDKKITKNYPACKELTFCLLCQVYFQHLSVLHKVSFLFCLNLHVDRLEEMPSIPGNPAAGSLRTGGQTAQLHTENIHGAHLNSYHSRTCLKRPLKRIPKIGFQDRLLLNAGRKCCRMLQESILQYFRPSLSYHLTLRSLFCLFLSGRLRQV